MEDEDAATDRHLIKEFGAREMNKSARIATLGLSAFLIAGCAVPVPLKVASWALDGISYVVTEKSMTDHGLSAVAQKDCAVWRGVTKGELCRDWQGGNGTLVADASSPAKPAPTRPAVKGFAPTASSDIPPLDTSLDDGRPSLDHMVNFVTAAGPSNPVRSTASSPRGGFHSAPRKRAATHAHTPSRPQLQPTQAAAPKILKTAKARMAVPPPALATVTKARRAQEPAAGIYFVIGSFRNYANAHQMTGRHGALLPVVLAANLDGAPVYRVVIGPARSGQEKALHRRLADRGLRDTWAIRVRPGDWTLARAVITRKKTAGLGMELANLRR